MPRKPARREKLDAKLKLEAHWLERGVTARRKRNQGRLEKLWEMRAQRAAMLSAAGTAKLKLASDDTKTKAVIVADRVTKRFGDRAIIKDFTLRITRGDRIGVVGANGSGKTTLLKLLTGELEPDEGTVTLAKTFSGTVIDQQRSLMTPEKNVRDILAEGGDWVDVRGVRKHVQGYLKDFLFDPGLVDARVGTLSGGERSRLLLAREFARKSNLLVLDEPTNDLDLETLDLLQEVIADYDGTVLIVSHDRDFLDRTVTVTLGLDGSGKVDIVAGGYADWEKQRQRRIAPAKKSPLPHAGGAGVGQCRPTQRPIPKNPPLTPPASGRGRSSPTRTSATTTSSPRGSRNCKRAIARDEAALHDPALYTRDPAKFAALSDAVARRGWTRTRRRSAGWNWQSLSRANIPPHPADREENHRIRETNGMFSWM